MFDNQCSLTKQNCYREECDKERCERYKKGLSRVAVGEESRPPTGALQTPDGGAGAGPADNWALKLLRQAKYSTAGLAISLNQIYSDHSPASRH